MPKTRHRKLLERHIQSGICKQHTLILGPFNFKSQFLALIEEGRRFTKKQAQLAMAVSTLPWSSMETQKGQNTLQWPENETNVHGSGVSK